MRTTTTVMNTGLTMALLPRILSALNGGEIERARAAASIQLSSATAIGTISAVAPLDGTRRYLDFKSFSPVRGNNNGRVGKLFAI